MVPAPSHHVPVMVQEVVEALLRQPNGIYIDGTFGRGGHTRALLARLGPRARVLALDRDPVAVQAAEALAQEEPRLVAAQAKFGELGELAQRHVGVRSVNGVVLDLGVSSPQLDDPQRGFSFAQDGPLDMRMTPDEGQSATQWLAVVAVEELERVLRELGEERYARRIARAIVAARATAPLTRTRELAELVARTVPQARRPTAAKSIHPATRTFQAVRIFINRELEQLEHALAATIEVLAPGGRLAVVSFHSLEDRIVKQFIRRASGLDPHPRKLPVRGAPPPGVLKAVGKLGRPSDAEIAANPRARSARLRVAQRTA